MFMARIDSTFRSSLVLLGWTLAATAQARCANGMNTSIPESTPTTAFTVRTDGTVLAKATGLMWARCPVGQVVSANACSGTPKAMTWAEAIIAAHASTLAGYTDWRLPNPKEALSIFEDRCDAPSLNADLFPIDYRFGLWTSTPAANLAGGYYAAWVLQTDGRVILAADYQEAPVLLVRDAR